VGRSAAKFKKEAHTDAAAKSGDMLELVFRHYEEKINQTKEVKKALVLSK
jgi:hypothetical protein